MLSIINSTKSNQNSNNSRGFTLIEMAISLVILGLLFAPFLNIYYNYQKGQEGALTDSVVRQSVVFLEEYRNSNGSYPCPARMNVANTDPAYGRAVDCSTAFSTYDPATIVAGDCSADGICMEEAVAARIGSLTDGNVIVGALPFRDLQLEEDAGLDSFGSRLVYAVTYSMTDRTSFDLTQGAISVVDNSGNTRVQPEGSADYIIFSTGKNRLGAYNRSGNLFSDCTGASLDIENCNVGFDTTAAASSDSVYVASLRNDAAGATFYDDVLEYSSKDTMSPWRRTDGDFQNIETLALDDVGVGTSAPTEKLTISSAGATPALRVSGTSGNDGKVFTDLVCDHSGNCFTPENIAGDNTANPADGSAGDGMKCPAGEYMVGVANSVAVCEAIVDVTCPDVTPVFRGLNADGSPICTTIPLSSCAAEDLDLCAVADVSLLPGGDGFPTGWQSAGDCRQRKYICSAGTWVTTSSRGACIDSVAAVSNPLCTSVAGYGPLIVSPFTTNYTITGGTTCFSGSSNTLLTDCSCVGIFDTENCAACPSGHIYTSPRPTYTREKQCRGNNTIEWWWTNTSACPATPSYCTCDTPAITERWVDETCPDSTNTEPHPTDGYKRKQVWDNANCNWKWKTPSTYSGSCVCKSGNITVATSTTCPACNESPVNGFNEYARDPGTCLATGAPLPSSVAAYCESISYKWTQSGTYTGSESAIIPFDVGDGCDCNVWPSASTVNCKDAANVKHKCNCQR